MARMVPGAGPRDHDPASREGVLYEALKRLPDEYVVVHSLRLLNLYDGALKEAEADFVVFNRERGLICIEAKAGGVRYEDGEWRYAGGLAMEHGGPFNQASNARYDVLDLFRQKGLGDLARRCRMLHAVWFPSIDGEDADRADLPPEARRELLLCKEDLADPEPALQRIFDLEVAGVVTDLTEAEAKRIVETVLCPRFDLVPNRRLRYDLQDFAFLQLLDSQKRVLDFLVDQRSAVINGVAGSGKTLLAVEHARRLSESGDRVLLLCYNAMLCDDLRQRCQGYRNVDVYTVAGYACRELDAREPDFAALEERLEARYASESFVYRHVIVDEGQDFAVPELEQAGLLQTLSLLSEQQHGTFYLFYDSNQLVQGTCMPRFIQDAECRLRLAVNCRNTRNVARCSIAALGEGARCRVRDSAVAGTSPILFASADPAEQAAFVDGEIEALRADGIDDIVVLTCKTEQKSALSPYAGDGEWRGARGRWAGEGVRFLTCRRFKGLEADAVILVDVDEDGWAEDLSDPFRPSSGVLFYTGATRARHELRIVCDMDEAGCDGVLAALGVEGRRKPFRLLAKRLNAQLAG